MSRLNCDFGAKKVWLRMILEQKCFSKKSVLEHLGPICLKKKIWLLEQGRIS